MVTVTMLPQSRPLTAADLETMPDDGHRYELIDGVLVVTPAPGWSHQDVVGSLHVLLYQTCPEDLAVVLAPFDIALAEDTVMQPDILVARRDDITQRNLPTAPLLAVEVASPSTRLFDRNTKKARFELAGTPSFWVVDPDEPSLTVWELHDGEYAEIAHVVGDDTFAASLPFPVDVTPSALRR